MKKLITLLIFLPIFLFGQKQSIIHLTTDQYPTETRWVLYADSLYGSIIHEVSYGYYTSPLTAHHDTVYIPDHLTQITFLIWDSYGDGMSGSYVLEVCGDSIVENYSPSFSYGYYHNRTVPQCMPQPPPGSGCVPALVNINLDQYQSETTWEIKDTTGTILAAGGPYTSAPDYEPQMIPVCLPTGNLTFTIYDSYGDGLAGSLWGGQDGSYYVIQCGDTLVDGSVANFGTDSTHTFISDTCTPPPPVPGCMDENYVEYDALATVDDGSCATLKIYGCTDSTMFNYDPTANWMDYIDSCNYTLILHDLVGNGWVGSKLEIYQDDTTVFYMNTPSSNQSFTIQLKAPETVKAKFFVSSQAQHTALECGFTLVNPMGDTVMSVVPPFIIPFHVYSGTTYCGTECEEIVEGCLDSTAFNYIDTANTSLPCYYYPGCISPAYLEYHVDTSNGYITDINIQDSCNTLAVFGCTDATAFNYDNSANVDNGGCIPVITGCMQPLAFNYNQNANTPDTCIAVVYGCMSPIAFNYDSLANTDDGSCIGVVAGCTDTSMWNYAPLANVDDSSCVPYIYGCTDATMWNYDASANTDNGTCIAYLYGCTDSTMYNYDPFVNTDNGTCVPFIYGCTNSAALNYCDTCNVDDGSCVTILYGCTDSTMSNYNALANVDNGTCVPFIYGCTNPQALNYCDTCNTDDYSCILPIYGCMDSSAFNYDPLANVDNNTCIPYIYGCTNPTALNYCDTCNTDDFSCILPIYGCTDSTMFNYDPLANTDNNTCIPFIYGCTNPIALNYNANANTDDFSCILPIYGCMDSTAFNYNPLANVDNGSCVPVILGCTDPIALNYCDSCNTDDFSCILPIYGCTDSTMFNYNPLANVDNNSCVPFVYGCTDPSMLNYNPQANTEDFSCIAYIYGCTDSTALNYDPLANTENGSCIEVVDGCMDPSAYNYSMLANVNDSSSCLYSAGCITGPGNPYWLNDECYAWVISVDDYCCENEWDTVCQATYDYCSGTWSGPLPTRTSVEEILIYPNPTNGLININETVDIIVYNMSGDIVISKTNINTLDMSRLSSGAYNLKITCNNKIVNKRIVKK